MRSEETPINAESPPRVRMPEASLRLPEAMETAALALEENVLWPVSDHAASFFEVARWPFERVGWALQRALVWPAQDRFEELDGRRRAILAGSGLAVIAIGATSLVLATSGGGSTAAPAAPVAVSPAPVVKTVVAGKPPAATAAPTLHGAAPVFKPAKQARHHTGKAASTKVVETALPASPTTTAPASSGSASVATAKISSRPHAAIAANTAADPQAIEGAPAGKQAIAVAHKFANAFVVFEIGGDMATVRKGFAASATPALAKSLLERPPRLPAGVKVPEAKVLNIVAGPSQDGVYSLSVSLLRVGVTSELRLEMEKLTGEGWRVTNVLG